MDNYRPISLLSNFSKIYEKIMSNRLTSYIEENELFTNCQYGFRKDHSTVHPLVHFMNTVSTALNKKHHVIAIFCDLRKAFDTVDHKILIKKLKQIGLGGVELAWFRSYLTDRKQFVYYNGKCSSLLELLLGVPQGSILGPLLFLIYINDLPLVSSLHSSLFADDTMLLASGPDIVELTSFVNTEFHKVNQFFRSHKLALHPNKTQYLLFTSSLAARDNPPVICINNSDIGAAYDQSKIIPIPNVSSKSEVPAVKFLGIYIDPLLNFKYHIGKLTKKLASALYFMRCAKNFLTTNARKAMYYSLFHSVLIYGIQLWSCSAKTNINGLATKQKMAIRIVHNSNYNDHSEPLFKISKILPIELLIDFFGLQFMHHYTQNYLPKAFDNTWSLSNDRRAEDFHINLRNNDAIDVPFARLISLERHPLTRFPKLWLDFNDENIKFIRNKQMFNKELKIFLLGKLSDVVICDRLFCYQCHPPDRL